MKHVTVVHWEVLYKTALNMYHVTSAVVKLVNFIWVRGMKHGQSLRLGTVFKKCFFYHIKIGLYLFKEFWLCSWTWKIKLLCSHTWEDKTGKWPITPGWHFARRKNLNVILQIKDLFLHEWHTVVQTIKTKQLLSQNKLRQIHLDIFLLYVEHRADKCSTLLSKPHKEFCIQYKYLKKAENKIQLLSCPFSFDGEKDPCNLQLKPTDLQSFVAWISESCQIYTPAAFNLLCHRLLII